MNKNWFFNSYKIKKRIKVKILKTVNNNYKVVNNKYKIIKRRN